jgi:hypothetical protein
LRVCVVVSGVTRVRGRVPVAGAKCVTTTVVGGRGLGVVQTHPLRRVSWWKEYAASIDPGWPGGGGGAAKLVRACGGCLGAGRLKGAAGCEKPGGAVKRALIPGYPS